MNFTSNELVRYTRHFSLEEIGIEGQQKLKSARILCIGAGGLGCPVLLYLTAAGIGTLGIVDHDQVELTNLQRQVLYTPQDIGRNKAEVASQKLKIFNPHSHFIIHTDKLTPENAAKIIRDYDIIVDCTDNFPSRYLINDSCYQLKKPNVYASISQFEGQCSILTGFDNGPCYRCIYAEPPPPGLIPNCSEAGVLGVLPGLLGVIQANEVIKLVTGIGAALVGRLIIFDALSLKMREMKVQKNKQCKLCGIYPDKDSLAYGVDVCSNELNDSISINKITAKQLESLRKQNEVFILDVRESYEYAICNIGGYLIPLNELRQRLSEIETKQLIVVHCKLGPRSEKAASILKAAGYVQVKVLSGGILAWIDEIDPSLTKY